MQDHAEHSVCAQVWSMELNKSVRAGDNAMKHVVFDSAKSQTFKPAEGEHWTIQYGDGSTASGNVGTDVLEVGGIQIKNQAIEMAQKLSPAFRQGTGDGLFGLAWGSINTVQPTQAKTPVENMILQSAIPHDNELFTAYLGSYKDKNDPDHGQSFYTFGHIDQEAVTASGSDIYYTPVDNSNGFWQFKSSSYSVGGATYPIPGGSAIADTGTTLAMVSDQMCHKIYEAIPGSKFSRVQGGYIFPTNTPMTALPEVKFNIGGKMFAVQKEDLAYADMGNGFSYGGIQSRGELPFSIYGDTWLKSVYAIFDVGRKRFGCVQRIEPSNSPNVKLARAPTSIAPASTPTPIAPTALGEPAVPK